MGGLVERWRFSYDHRFTQQRASQYLDGELSAGGRRRVERHAGVCPPCRRLLATLRRTLADLGRLSVKPHAGVAEGVLERLHKQP